MADLLVTPTVSIQTSNVDSPDYRSAEFNRQRAEWQIATDLQGGTKRIREKKTVYMPQFEDEDTKDWDLRVESVWLDGGFNDTIAGLTGMVFAKDPQLGEDVDAKIKEHWEDIDGKGTHGDLFARAAFENGLAKGFSILLTDFANVTPADLDLGQFNALGLRPYWSRIAAEQVINFRTQYRGSKMYVTLLVVFETIQEPVGEYGFRDVNQWRVYTHSLAADPRDDVIGWKVMRQKEDKTFAVFKQGVYLGVDEIPISVVYTGNVVGTLEATSPLSQIMYMIIALLRLNSDHMHGLHKSAIPIFVRSGVPYDPNKAEDKLRLGYNTAIDIPDPNGKAYYVETKGSALEQLEKKCASIKGEIARSGLMMLEKRSAAPESFESKRLDHATQDSKLATAVRSLGDAFERQLRFHAMFMGLDPKKGGSITFNRDFEALTLDPALIDKYIQLVELGRLSLRTFYQIMVMGKALPRGFDWEEEKKQIELEGGGEPKITGKPLPKLEDEDTEPLILGDPDILKDE